MNEGTISKHIQLAAAYQGLQLWRNNVGAYQDETGRVIRYGLANDSKKLNAEIKSSDLIGITRVLITPEMYGRVLGVFSAIECKPPGWKFSEADTRAVAQQAFHRLVLREGGFAGFAQSPEDMLRIVGRK